MTLGLRNCARYATTLESFDGSREELEAKVEEHKFRVWGLGFTVWGLGVQGFRV